MKNDEIEKQEIIKQENNIVEGKEIATNIMLEEIISKSIRIPGVKVDRNKFLAEVFSNKANLLKNILDSGTIEAGISREEINSLANKLIIKRTGQSSFASFAAGIPGGLAMAATIPADILQFFGMSLRLAQELSYLYGADDLWKHGQVDDERVKNQLILYCGVMFGVSGAVCGVRVLSTQVAKTALKKIPQKALTKTFWYPMIKKICSLVGYTLTKKTLASGVSKVLPFFGGAISGAINFASMMPMAQNLHHTLDKAVFDYSEAEYNQDIEYLNNETGEVTEEEVLSFREKFTDKFNKTKNNVSNMFSKLGNNDKSKVDPIVEIKKYKELLDSGIITEEEFNKKKKELLDL